MSHDFTPAPEFAYCIDGMTELGRITIDLTRILHLYPFSKEESDANKDAPSFEEVIINKARDRFNTAAEYHKITTMFCSLVTNFYSIHFEREIILGLFNEVIEKYFEKYFDFYDPKKNIFFWDRKSSSADPREIISSCFSDPYLKNYFELLNDSVFRIQKYLGNISVDDYIEALRLEHFDHQREIEERYILLNSCVPIIETRKIIVERKTRKSITRALKIGEKLLGDKLKLFIKDKEVLIEGELFNYRLVRNSSIIETTEQFYSHTPFELQILTKNNDRICNGCVYFADTPILDQIIAIALHVSEREQELIFLKTANKFNTTDIYHEYSSLISNETLLNQSIDLGTEYHATLNYHRDRYRKRLNTILRKSLMDRIENPIIKFMFTPKNKDYDSLVDFNYINNHPETRPDIQKFLDIVKG